jgi:hypothetical protein
VHALASTAGERNDLVLDGHARSLGLEPSANEVGAGHR